jgi:hypothetical protein
MTTRRKIRHTNPHERPRRRFWITAGALVSTVVVGLALAAWFGLAVPSGQVVAPGAEVSEPATAQPAHSGTDPQASPTAGTDPRAKDRGPFPVRPPHATGRASASPTPTTRPRPVPIAEKGSGNFAVALGRSGRNGIGKLIRYQVDVEQDLPFPPVNVGRAVHDTLSDRRGWAFAGWASFERVDSGPVDLHILLATPATTERLCRSVDGDGDISCHVSDRIVINARAWAAPAPTFGVDLDNYHDYVLNHEIGHLLGKGHGSCAGGGVPAPVMMQQSETVEKCRPNAWPLASELERPNGATPAPE